MSSECIKKEFYCLVFNSTTDTISTEKKLKESFKTFIIPTPREISKSCGFAIRFSGCEEADLIDAFDRLEVACRLYLIGRDNRGNRQSFLIREREIGGKNE